MLNQTCSTHLLCGTLAWLWAAVALGGTPPKTSAPHADAPSTPADNAPPTSKAALQAALATLRQQYKDRYLQACQLPKGQSVHADTLKRYLQWERDGKPAPCPLRPRVQKACAKVCAAHAQLAQDYRRAYAQIVHAYGVKRYHQEQGLNVQTP